MNKIKWGIISTGRIANEFASDFSFVNHGELYAVASRSEEKAKEFAGRYGMPAFYKSYEQLYADPNVDAVYVATPHNLHFENSIKALQAGKAVLCEKPITINSEEFNQLQNVALESGSYLMEGLWTYFLPATQQALKWSESGQIGQVKHIKMEFGFAAPFDPKGRLFNPDLAGGALLDIGIYTLAIPWRVTGEKPAIIHVDAEKGDTGVDEDVLVSLRHGACKTTLHFSLRYTLPNVALLVGETGYIRIPDFYKASECFLYDKSGKIKDHFKDNRKSIGFNYEIEAVNKDLLEGKTSSDVMPLHFSGELQDQMDQIKKRF